MFQTKDIPGLREDTYELCYNSACALAGKAQYGEAEKKLRASEKICRESLDEDDDIEDEIGIIKVQLAYCMQMQGKIKEATAVYTDALKHKSSDPALTAVASNNMVAINKDQNVFDSKKKIRAAMSEACEHKLTSRQKKIIAINNCLLTLYTNQDDQCHQLVAKLIQTYPECEFTGVLIRASQFSKDKKYKEAIDLLDKYIKGHPKDALATNFAKVQLLLLNVSIIMAKTSYSEQNICFFVHRATKKAQSMYSNRSTKKNIFRVWCRPLYPYCLVPTTKQLLRKSSRTQWIGIRRTKSVKVI